MYKIVLADETEVEFEGVNGNNFIVPGKEEMDTSIFTDENLETGKVADDEGNEYPFTNLAFTQQQRQLDGNYYICFHEKSEQDQINDEVKSLLAETGDIKDTLVRIAEIQIELGNMTVDDLEGSIRDTVKADTQGGLEKDFP